MIYDKPATKRVPKKPPMAQPIRATWLMPLSKSKDTSEGGGKKKKRENGETEDEKGTQAMFFKLFLLRGRTHKVLRHNY